MRNKEVLVNLVLKDLDRALNKIQRNYEIRNIMINNFDYHDRINSLMYSTLVECIDKKLKLIINYREILSIAQKSK